MSETTMGRKLIPFNFKDHVLDILGNTYWEKQVSRKKISQKFVWSNWHRLDLSASMKIASPENKI